MQRIRPTHLSRHDADMEMVSPAVSPEQSPSGIEHRALLRADRLETAGPATTPPFDEVNWLRRTTMTSLLCLCALSTVEGMEGSLMATSFRGLEIELGFDAAVLAHFSLIGTCGYAISCPIWGMIVDRYPRRPVLMLGYWGWIICLFGMAFCRHEWQFYILRMLNAICVSSMMPVSQSLLAEIIHPAKFGTVFGYLGVFHCVGHVFSAVAGTTLSQATVYGFPGWRVGYVGMSAFGMLFGLFFAKFFVEPDSDRGPPAPFSISAEIERFKTYVKIPSFCFIVIQGIFGCMPWCAMGYLTLFWQYNGLTDRQIGFVIGAKSFTGSFGSLLGGYMADKWEMRWKNHGRVCVAVLSKCICIPVMLWLLFLDPSDNQMYFTMSTFVACLFHLTGTWTVLSVNRPVLAYVVDPTDRGTIFAWQSTIENFIASAVAYPVLAMMSKSNGYKASRDKIEDTPMQQRMENAGALRASMVPFIVVPWMLGATFYSMLHFTLPKDMRNKDLKDKARLAKRSRPGGAVPVPVE